MLYPQSATRGKIEVKACLEALGVVAPPITDGD